MAKPLPETSNFGPHRRDSTHDVFSCSMTGPAQDSPPLVRSIWSISFCKMPRMVGLAVLSLSWRSCFTWWCQGHA